MDEEVDKNAKYFHRVVKSHIAKNKILRLKDETGSMVEDYERGSNHGSWSFFKSSLQNQMDAGSLDFI